MIINNRNIALLRSLIFGLEDGLVSTTGTLIGIAVGSQNKKIILLSALVLIAVEATSMAAGQYLSEKSVEEALQKTNKRTLLKSSLVMLLSYIAAGSIVTLPYLFLPNKLAGIISVLTAFMVLYSVGYFKAQAIGIKNKIRSGLEVLMVGGICTIIGIVAGYAMRVS